MCISDINGSARDTVHPNKQLEKQLPLLVLVLQFIYTLFFVFPDRTSESASALAILCRSALSETETDIIIIINVP